MPQTYVHLRKMEKQTHQQVAVFNPIATIDPCDKIAEISEVKAEVETPKKSRQVVFNPIVTSEVYDKIAEAENTNETEPEPICSKKCTDDCCECFAGILGCIGDWMCCYIMLSAL